MDAYAKMVRAIVEGCVEQLPKSVANGINVRSYSGMVCISPISDYTSSTKNGVVHFMPDFVRIGPVEIRYEDPDLIPAIKREMFAVYNG